MSGALEVSWSSALTTTSFDVLRSIVFFYIKSPLRVEEAGLQERSLPRGGPTAPQGGERA